MLKAFIHKYTPQLITLFLAWPVLSFFWLIVFFASVTLVPLNIGFILLGGKFLWTPYTFTVPLVYTLLLWLSGTQIEQALAQGQPLIRVSLKASVYLFARLFTYIYLLFVCGIFFPANFGLLGRKLGILAFDALFFGAAFIGFTTVATFSLSLFICWCIKTILQKRSAPNLP